MKKEEKLIGKGVKFQRVRRITGYLVGSLERFNDAKRAEEKDRVKHFYHTSIRNAKPPPAGARGGQKRR